MSLTAQIFQNGIDAVIQALNFLRRILRCLQNFAGEFTGFAGFLGDIGDGG